MPCQEFQLFLVLRYVIKLCVVCLYMIVANRVRVAVRLRPRNTEELHADIDFADCVELQPEVCLYPSRVSSILSCSSK